MDFIFNDRFQTGSCLLFQSAFDEVPFKGYLVQWGSITVHLTSCLFCLDSAALLMMNEQQFYLFGQIQTSQT